MDQILVVNNAANNAFQCGASLILGRRYGSNYIFIKLVATQKQLPRVFVPSNSELREYLWRLHLRAYIMVYPSYVLAVIINAQCGCESARWSVSGGRVKRGRRERGVKRGYMERGIESGGWEVGSMRRAAGRCLLALSNWHHERRPSAQEDVLPLFPLPQLLSTVEWESIYDPATSTQCPVNFLKWALVIDR